MTPSRIVAATALAAAGFVLLPAACAQDPPIPRKPNIGAVNEARESRGIKKEDLPRVREQMAAFAKFHADVVSHPLVYRVMQDPTKAPTGMTVPNLDVVFKDLDRYLLEPNPFNRGVGDPKPRVNDDHADYIREMGVAFDAALKPVVNGTGERIVRVNAARLYALVCRTGAAAHWPTVTEWLTKETTPTDIKFYALQAAANLLSAYDVFDYRSRRHAISKEPRAEADREIGALIAAVEKCVLDPNAIIALPKKADDVTPDQLAVVGYVRRQAVKTLGQVRFITLPGPDGSLIYPAATLVRVAMSDPALVPAPTPAECGEAVIGLCNMSPNLNGNPIKGFNAGALVEAMATGIIKFAGPRAADPLDKSVPWRGYSVRMADAFRNWPPLFDPLFDPLQPARFSKQEIPAAVTDLIDRTRANVLAPIDKVGAGGGPDLGSPVNIQAMNQYLVTLQDRPKRSAELITGVPATALPGAGKK